jgi:8-oxo-(d)GTP phosphatase
VSDSGERTGSSQQAGEIRAAGAVLYRPGADGIEVAVIHRPRRSDWSLPKGKLEPGEHVLAAAVREVTEETGIRPVLGPPLGTVHYPVEGRPKRVDYWAATPGEKGAARDGDEVDRVEWLPLALATARLSYARDVDLVGRLASSPASRGGTTAFILLRHASAGSKDIWPGDDLLRPLDERGREEARTLAGLLAAYAPTRVISSAAERCLATVRPYAERIGAGIVVEPAFTVPAPPGGEEAARRRLSELLASVVPAVICLHRENVVVLLAHARAELGEPRPAPERSPPKAGFYVLHVAGRGLVAQELHDLSLSGL